MLYVGDFWYTIVIDRTMALSETCRTELFGHSLSETTELNRTELSKFDWTFLIFFSHYDSQYEKSHQNITSYEI